MSAEAPSDDRLQAVLATLQASRTALRRELLPSEAELQRERNASSGHASPGFSRWWRRMRRAARGNPILNLAAEAARGWWRQQPWHTGTEQLAHGVLAQGRPLVRRHPLAAVALAAAAGAALAACRPWRWQAVGQPLRALPGRATHWLLAQLASAPVQAALVGMLLSGLRTEQEPANDAAPTSSGNSGPPEPGMDQAAAGANTRNR